MSKNGEGELYKKTKHITQAVPTNEAEDNNFVPFTYILDEAKAEIPKLDSIILPEGCFLSLEDEQLEIRRQSNLIVNKYYEETQAWFKKWFGVTT